MSIPISTACSTSSGIPSPVMCLGRPGGSGASAALRRAARCSGASPSPKPTKEKPATPGCLAIASPAFFRSNTLSPPTTDANIAPLRPSPFACIS